MPTKIKEFKRFDTYTIELKSNLFPALIVWFTISFVFASIIYALLGSIVLSAIFAAIIGITGFKADTYEITADQAVPVYDRFTNNPKFNYSGGGIIWLRCGLFKLGGLYDQTVSVDTREITKNRTADSKPAQFANYFADIESYLADPLAYEVNSGSDDSEKIIELRQIDVIQKWGRKKTLSELESGENFTIGTREELEDDIIPNMIIDNASNISEFKEIQMHMRNYGVILSDTINIRDITSPSDEARQKLANTFFDEANEDLKKERFDTRVNKNYLAHLARHIDGKDDHHFLKIANSELETEERDRVQKINNLAIDDTEKVVPKKISEYRISLRAVALAEKIIKENKDSKSINLSDLYDKCLVQEQNRQGIVPRTQNEIIGDKNSGAIPVINISKNK
jgi:hypothetical protein